VTAVDVVISSFVALLMALTLVGLVRRDRVRFCRSLALYLLTTLVCNQLVTHFPRTFFNRSFWTLKETLYAGLYCAITLELAAFVFAGLPRARRLVFAALAVCCVGTGLIVSAADADMRHGLLLLITACHACAAWLAAILMSAVIYWRLPLHHFHKTVLWGLTIHLSIYAAVLALLAQDWEFRIYATALERPVVVLQLFFWLWAAWRVEPARDLAPQAAAILQPWALRP
jgi:hypothetical protein